MKRKFPALEPEGFLILLNASLATIPFNVVLAALLGFMLVYNQVPINLVSLWLAFLLLVSVVRWLNSKVCIKKKFTKSQLKKALFLFTLLTFLAGCSWGSAYLLFLPHVDLSHETLIILVLGGMSAGAIASLSAYLPAYYAYVVPIFSPILAYNFFMFEIDRFLLGLMYFLFIVVIFVTANISSRLQQSNFRLGKEKDSLINKLTQTNVKLEKSMQTARRLSITDPLTRLFNRRYFDMVFINELKRAQREDYALNLVLIDIDNFKTINDNYGHPSGDEFLIYVAKTLKKSVRRSNDFLFRLGGDEFALILANSRPDKVLPLCNNIQKQFTANNPYKNVTLSMSLVSNYASSKLDKEAIVTLADRTLYQAKKEGKNRIIHQISQ
jgi:diguanylate cyclase (GGDEF)-like protein